MYRCIQFDSLPNGTCANFTQASSSVIFRYTDENNFMSYFEIVNGLETLLDNSAADEVCRRAVAYIVCNYVFIPCNLTTGNPRPICTQSCNYYFTSRCKEIFDTIVQFSTVIDYPFMNDCPNTLSHLEAFEFFFLSDSFADDCIDIIGVYGT